jgi:hypothetical protein
MGFQKGFAAAAGLKTSRGGGGDTYRFITKTGQIALVRFFGKYEEQEDPVWSKKHYVKRLPGADSYQQCGDNVDVPCLSCFLKDRGDKGIGTSTVGNLFLNDYSKYHSMDKEVKALKPTYQPRAGQKPGSDDYELTQYPTCLRTKTRPCPWCEQGNEAKPRGFKYWDLAEGHLESLISQRTFLRDFCRCGAVTEDDEVPGPTLYVDSYYCSNPNCNEDCVGYSPEQGTYACRACGNTLVPAELLGCTNEDCPGPERCDLTDFIFRIRKTGEKKTTKYDFEPIIPCRPPTEEEWKQALEYYPDWSQVLAPIPPEQLAAKLGIPCPFTTPGHGAVRASSGRLDTPRPTDVSKPLSLSERLRAARAKKQEEEETVDVPDPAGDPATDGWDDIPY